MNIMDSGYSFKILFRNPHTKDLLKSFFSFLFFFL